MGAASSWSRYHKTIRGRSKSGDKDIYYRPEITKDRKHASSRKMVNENQEVPTVTYDLSRQNPTSYPLTSIQPPQGQRQEPERNISNSFEPQFEVELDPFTTV